MQQNVKKAGDLRKSRQYPVNYYGSGLVPPKLKTRSDSTFFLEQAKVEPENADNAEAEARKKLRTGTVNFHKIYDPLREWEKESFIWCGEQGKSSEFSSFVAMVNGCINGLASLRAHLLEHW